MRKTELVMTMCEERKRQLAIYSEGDVQVVMACESIESQSFLVDIKQQKGGGFAEEEFWIVENIVPNLIYRIQSSIC